MTIHAVLFICAGFLFLLSAGYIALKKEEPKKNAWMVPAALSVLFLGFSLYTVVTEGLFGFWPEHTQNF